jgi:hypothetical protein
MEVTPAVVGKSFLEAVLFSVVVSVTTHFVIRYFTKG